MLDLSSRDILFLLDFGIIGFGVLLAILMYNLLTKAQKRRNEVSKLIPILKFYFILSISIFLLGGIVQIFEYYKKPAVSIEIKPSDPKFWKESPKNFNWFNAQYKLAKDEFIELNSDKITNNVVYHLLCFTGDDVQSQSNSSDKFNRMRDFLRKLNQEVGITDENIKVGIVPKSKMPSISFFNTLRNDKPVTIYYLEELVQADGVPTLAFEVSHEMVVKFFETEFAKFWKMSEPIILNDLIDQNINTEEILSKYR